MSPLGQGHDICKVMTLVSAAVERAELLVKCGTDTCTWMYLDASSLEQVNSGLFLIK